MIPSAHREWGILRRDVDPLARQFGFYTAYPLTEDERVTNLMFQNWRGAYRWLKADGYRYNALAAAKTHPDIEGQVDILSMRKVPTRHPDVQVAITREWEPRQCQYHVHVFDKGNMEFEFFSHYEVRPDLLKPTFNPSRLMTHYRPEYGETYLKGVASPVFDGVTAGTEPNNYSPE